MAPIADLTNRTTRIVAVLLLAICASGVLVYFNVVLAENLFIVPFLLIGYVALELLHSKRATSGKDSP
ncbi:MAG: hypothetical protein M3081_09000 [Gemmatimonadota bacterium]|nr:hypothetical protein [Gemmatimonadota bacterium]